jgi:hypothetical protein
MNELANNTSVNMSRNCQEISAQVGKELCALIDQEFDKKHEEDNKKRLELERYVNSNHIYTISIVCDIILLFDERETKMTTPDFFFFFSMRAIWHYMPQCQLL